MGEVGFTGNNEKSLENDMTKIKIDAVCVFQSLEQKDFTLDT